MDEAEARISNMEDTVDSEKQKSDALAKQVTLLTNKLDDLENRSQRSYLRKKLMCRRRWREQMQLLSWRGGYLTH